MNGAVLDALIALIDELEGLFAEAKHDPLSPAWTEMQDGPACGAGSVCAVAAALASLASLRRKQNR
ncbi:MAG: hypothetical protein WBA53_08640 [Burkholderiaceae bacterium]